MVYLGGNKLQSVQELIQGHTATCHWTAELSLDARSLKCQLGNPSSLREILAELGMGMWNSRYDSVLLL